EVDAEVLDRLARELGAHALVDLAGDRLRDRDRLGERRGVGRVGVERAERERAELLRGGDAIEGLVELLVGQRRARHGAVLSRATETCLARCYSVSLACAG